MVELNGSGGNAFIPMVKTGMTNLLSLVFMILNSSVQESYNSIYATAQSVETYEQEAQRLSRRKNASRFLQLAERSPDLLFESNTDIIQNVEQDRNVISSHNVADVYERNASHTIGTAFLMALASGGVLYVFRNELFG
jgi:hypothetical protein